MALQHCENCHRRTHTLMQMELGQDFVSVCRDCARGPKNKAAVALGKRTSPKKAAAARRNAQKRWIGHTKENPNGR